MNDKHVFVLGAGFTRGLLADAPLATDHFPALDEENFKSYPPTELILTNSKQSDGRVDIESLHYCPGKFLSRSATDCTEDGYWKCEQKRFESRVEKSLSKTRFLLTCPGSSLGCTMYE
jgi:hypothetical protein